MDEVTARIERVAEDLRAIQQELNLAAMQTPADPEEEPISVEALETLKSALDQMRHFLWFYEQVVGSESEFGDKLRQVPAKTANDETPKLERPFLDQLSRADEVVLMHHMADAKRRKPN